MLQIHPSLLENVSRGVQWLLGAACLWLVVAVLLRGELPEPALAVASELRADVVSAGSDLKLESFDSIWTRQLRQTLIEPKPKPRPKAEPRPPAPKVKLPKLVATFVEDGRSWGLFIDAKGGLRVRSAGQTIDDFTVVVVTPAQATLERYKKSYKVSVAQDRTRRSRTRRR